MKAAIVTITDGANYGNRLQNYALQSVIKDLGANVCTLRIKSSNNRSLPEEVLFTAKNVIKRMLGKEYATISIAYKRRKKRFDDFDSRYINFSKETLKCNSSPKNIANRYDCFVVGSDQVWNSRIKIICENIENYLLTFAPPDKRVAYAASFGTKDIPGEFSELFANELSKFKKIGVRENDGIALVAQSCGKRAEVVLDPTLLLEKSRWNEISKRPAFSCPEKYILTYFLGGRSTKMRKYIDDLASQLNCQVINLDNDYIAPETIENEAFYQVTPDEFVWLISHADCMLTDSFHGSVFSILYGIPFYVFNRVNVEKGNEMSGRITTLLDIFHLNDRLKSLDSPSGVPESFPVNEAAIVLQEKRRQSTEFLRKVLEG